MAEVATVGIPSIFGLTGTQTAFQDEGVLLGDAQVINFVGDGVVATLAAGVLTVQVDGGATVDLVTTLEAVTETDTTHGVAASVIFELGTVFGQALAEKAGLSSPAFTDTPTAPTAEPSSNNLQIANTAYADNAANNGRDEAKTYADSLVINLWDDRGTFDPTAGTWPTSADNGSGVDGAILKGDTWSISVAGVLAGGIVVNVGDVIRSLVDGAGNTSTDWGVTENNLGYVAENSANKSTDLNSPDNTTYPTTQAVVDGLDTKEPSLPAAVGATKFLREDRTFQDLPVSREIGGNGGNTLSATAVAINCTGCTISGANTTLTNCYGVNVAIPNVIGEGSLIAPYNFTLKMSLVGTTINAATGTLTADGTALSVINAPRANYPASDNTKECEAIHKLKIMAWRDFGLGERQWLVIAERIIKVATTGAANVHDCTVAIIGTDKTNSAGLSVTAFAANGATSALNIGVAITGGLAGIMLYKAEIESTYIPHT